MSGTFNAKDQNHDDLNSPQLILISDTSLKNQTNRDPPPPPKKKQKNPFRTSDISQVCAEKARLGSKGSRRRLGESELGSEQMKLSEQLCDALNWPSQAGHDLVTTVSKNQLHRAFTI